MLGNYDKTGSSFPTKSAATPKPNGQTLNRNDSQQSIISVSPDKPNGRASVMEQDRTGGSLIRDSSITKIDMSVRIEGTRKQV